MHRDVTQAHYSRLAATYDQNWAYSPDFLEWMTGCILARLGIGDGDMAADIGCGTGLFTRGLAEHAAAVVCVDASEPMLAQVPAGGTVTPVVARVEDVAAGRVPLPGGHVDAMLLKEVLHHADDRAAVIAGLAKLLWPGGRMLVVQLPARISYPLFDEALEVFAAQQPDPAGIAEAMGAAGLRAELTYERFPLVFETERFLGMVRDRYMSLLSYFDDERLEAGVAEIQRAHPGETIAFDDTFAFVLGVAA